MVTVWASMAARTAANVGDPAAALRAAERGIAVDPEFSFVFLGTYLRLARLWAQAMIGQDPAGAADRAEQMIRANLLDPPSSCVATWFGLLGEMRLAAGQLDRGRRGSRPGRLGARRVRPALPRGADPAVRARLLEAARRTAHRGPALPSNGPARCPSTARLTCSPAAPRRCCGSWTAEHDSAGGPGAANTPSAL